MAQSDDDNTPNTNGYSTDDYSKSSRVSTPDLFTELGLVSTPYCPLDSCRSMTIEEFEKRLEEDSSYSSSSGSNSPDPETDDSDRNQSPTANSNSTPQSPNALLRAPVKEETPPPTTSLQPTSQSSNEFLLTPAKKEKPLPTNNSQDISQNSNALLLTPVMKKTMSPTANMNPTPQSPNALFRSPVKEETPPPTTNLEPSSNYSDATLLTMAIAQLKQRPTATSLSLKNPMALPMATVEDQQKFLEERKEEIWKKAELNNLHNRDDNSMFHVNNIMKKKQQDSRVFYNTAWQSEFGEPKRFANTRKEGTIKDRSMQGSHSDKNETNCDEAPTQSITTNPLKIKTQQTTKQYQPAIKMENKTRDIGKIGKLIFDQSMVQQNFELNLKKKTNESRNVFPKIYTKAEWSTVGSWEQSCSKLLERKYQPNIKVEILDESDYLQAYAYSGCNNQKLFEDRSVKASFTKEKTQPAGSLMMTESLFSPGTIESAFAAVADIASDYKIPSKKKELHHVGVPASSSQKEEDRRERVEKQKKFPDEKKPHSNDSPQKSKDNKKSLKRSIKEEILDEPDYAQSSADLRFKKQKLLVDGSAKTLQPLANAVNFSFSAQPSNDPDSNNKKRKLNVGNSIQTQPNDSECSARPGSDEATKKRKLANGKVVNLKNQSSVNSQRNLNKTKKERENANLQIKKKELELAMNELKKRINALDTELSSLPGHLKTLIGHVKREKTSHDMSPVLAQNAINALKIVWNERETELKKKKRQIRKKIEDLSEESD